MFLLIKHGSTLVDKLMIKTVEHGVLKTHMRNLPEITQDANIVLFADDTSTIIIKSI
jgi:hypothetical protein